MTRLAVRRLWCWSGSRHARAIIETTVVIVAVNALADAPHAWLDPPVRAA